MRCTRQVTQRVALQCSDARIFSMLVWTKESGYDKHCGSKDNDADNESVHHVQEMVDVLESQLKPRLVFYSPDIYYNRGGIQKAKNIIMKQNDSNCAITRK